MCGPCGTLRAIEIKNVEHSTQTKGEIEREKGEENKRGGKGRIWREEKARHSCSLLLPSSG